MPTMDIEGTDLFDVEVTPVSRVVLSSLLGFCEVLGWPLLKYKLTNKQEKPICVFVTKEITGLPYPYKLSPDIIDLKPCDSPPESPWYPPSQLKDANNSTLSRELQISIRIDYNCDGEEGTRFLRGYTITVLSSDIIYWVVSNPKKEGESLPLLDYLVEWAVPVDPYVRRKLNRELNKKPVLITKYPRGQDPDELVRRIHSMLKLKDEDEDGIRLRYNSDSLDASLFQYREHGVILQSVRRPKQTLYGGDANCIEGAVLYASLIEAAGLDAAILFSAHKDEESGKYVDGHALVGWRKEKDAEDYEFLETTVRPGTSFEIANNAGKRKYQEVKDLGHDPFGSESFAYLLPIKEIRKKIYHIPMKVVHPSSPASPTKQAPEEKVIEPEELLGTGNHFAVLVGASSYEAEDIYDQKQICPNDAEILYQQLLVNSFHPSRLHLLADKPPEPLTNGSILSCLRAIANASTVRDLLLFYYSGAIRQDKQNYFLLTFDVLAGSSPISLTQVREHMLQAAAQAKVVVLDIYDTELDPQDPRIDDLIEEFMRGILEQLKDLTVLASYKEKDKEVAASLFTNALVKELEQLPESRESLTVQNIYDNVSNKTPIYPKQPYKAEQTIICRSRKKIGDYFLSSYQYLVHMQKTLESVQGILAQPRITKDDIQDAITVLNTLLKALDDIEQSEKPTSLIDANRLRDTRYALRRRVEYLMVQELEPLLGETGPIIAQYACNDVKRELLSILADVVRKNDELRATIMPGNV